MILSKIYILVSYVAFSITSAYATEQKDSLYKILKIQLKGDYYVINAQRNDSLFKIISKKVSTAEQKNLEPLRRGKHYHLDFGTKNNGTPRIETIPLQGDASYLHIQKNRYFTDGKTKIKFSKRNQTTRKFDRVE